MDEIKAKVVLVHDEQRVLSEGEALVSSSLFIVYATTVQVIFFNDYLMLDGETAQCYTCVTKSFLVVHIVCGSPKFPSTAIS